MFSKFIAYGAVTLVIGGGWSAIPIYAGESVGHTSETHARTAEDFRASRINDVGKVRAEDDHARAEDTRAEESPEQALVVFVFDKSCKISCGRVRSMIRQLREEYAGRVRFIELDVSKDSLPESKKIADSLGIGSYLQESEDWYPAVAFFSANHRMVKELLGTRSK